MDERQRIALELIESLGTPILDGHTRLEDRINWPKITTVWDLLSTGEQVVVGAAAVIDGSSAPWKMAEAATVVALFSRVDADVRGRVLEALQAASSLELA